METEEISASVHRQLRRSDRFDNYVGLFAKFSTPASKTLCGHAVKEGEVIGWSKRHGVRCKDCWARWQAENEEEDRLERSAQDSMGY